MSSIPSLNRAATIASAQTVATEKVAAKLAHGPWLMANAGHWSETSALSPPVFGVLRHVDPEVFLTTPDVNAGRLVDALPAKLLEVPLHGI